MTMQRTVRLDAPPHLAMIHRAALATLPEHFRIIDGGHADAALVEDAANSRQARVVVATDTLSAPATEAVSIPAIRFSPRLLIDPTVKKARSTEFELYDCIIRLCDVGTTAIREGLLEQMAAIRAVTGEALRLTKFIHAGESYLAEGVIGRRRSIASLTGITGSSPGPAFVLDAANCTQRLEIEIDESTIARPSRIRLFGPKEVTEGAQLHQTDTRLTWLAAHAALDQTPRNGYQSSEWRADIADVLRLLPFAEVA